MKTSYSFVVLWLSIISFICCLMVSLKPFLFSYPVGSRICWLRSGIFSRGFLIVRKWRWRCALLQNFLPLWSISFLFFRCRFRPYVDLNIVLHSAHCLNFDFFVTCLPLHLDWFLFTNVWLPTYLSLSMNFGIWEDYFRNPWLFW